jgi:predicted transcriptional regulator
MPRPTRDHSGKFLGDMSESSQSLHASCASSEQSLGRLLRLQDYLARRHSRRKRHKDFYRLMTQDRTPSPIIYHQELAILSRFFNEVDRFIHTATFGEGERFAYTRELMAVLRAVFLGQIEGRPMGIARLSRHLAMPRATTERKLRELQKRGLVSRHGRGFIIPVDSLNQPRMADTLERLILMIHKAAAKLPKMG